MRESKAAKATEELIQKRTTGKRITIEDKQEQEVRMKLIEDPNTDKVFLIFMTDKFEKV
jgi:hypothetical protein